MSVYIDHARLRYGRMLMSHMLADTNEELMAMAELIGVAAKWLQNPGKPNEHFDVCNSKRLTAIQYGAVPIEIRQVVTLMRAKRKALPVTCTHHHWVDRRATRGGAPSERQGDR